MRTNDDKVAAGDHIERQDVPGVAALYLELSRPVIRLYPFEELHLAVHACYELPLHMRIRRLTLARHDRRCKAGKILCLEIGWAN